MESFDLVVSSPERFNMGLTQLVGSVAASCERTVKLVHFNPRSS